MTTEREYYIRAFEYARGKVKSGEWSWEQAFEYVATARDKAESFEWSWEKAFEWCKQACEACFK